MIGQGSEISISIFLSNIGQFSWNFEESLLINKNYQSMRNILYTSSWKKSP